MCRKWFWEKRIEIEKIEPQRGVDGKCSGYYVKSKTCKNQNIGKWLLDSTVVLGWDSQGNKGAGHGEWIFKIDKNIRKNLKSIDLKITSIRTHEGLHTPQQIKQQGEGSVYINNNGIDTNIALLSKMPNGKDLGMHQVGPYPIINWINNETEKYVIRLEVNDYALWGIDEVSLEPVVERWRLKTAWSLVFGALLSGIVGLIFFKIEGDIINFIGSLM